MTILHVNGETRPLSPTLTELLKELGLGDAVVATALNGHFVAADERDAATLRSGDAIEILAPLQGG
ncbi:sulfur carrier protein ThiS [Saccharibacter floricola]|uniref:Thiamine biosynthesis protein ThiS n=1 Tax=Saccharibacter floricola DSM 15669 TaxID=1123227 RepID=A0ABQ0NX71_9PROT|nr:sulfur carrier protein ThiS [Saccharibacter floricola]GBQ04921.1 thiamine biosynthesis protein ThiS [Saccharibacter floricola DSM 15669]